MPKGYWPPSIPGVGRDPVDSLLTGPKEPELPPGTGLPFWPVLVLVSSDEERGAADAAFEKTTVRSGGRLEMPVVVTDTRLRPGEARAYKVLRDAPRHVIALAAFELRMRGYDVPEGVEDGEG